MDCMEFPGSQRKYIFGEFSCTTKKKRIGCEFVSETFHCVADFDMISRFEIASRTHITTDATDVYADHGLPIQAATHCGAPK